MVVEYSCIMIFGVSRPVLNVASICILLYEFCLHSRDTVESELLFDTAIVENKPEDL